MRAYAAIVRVFMCHSGLGALKLTALEQFRVLWISPCSRAWRRGSNLCSRTEWWLHRRLRRSSKTLPKLLILSRGRYDTALRKHDRNSRVAELAFVLTVDKPGNSLGAHVFERLAQALKQCTVHLATESGSSLVQVLHEPLRERDRRAGTVGSAESEAEHAT